MESRMEGLLRVVKYQLFGGREPEWKNEDVMDMLREARAQTVFLPAFSTLKDRLREQNPAAYLRQQEVFLGEIIGNTNNFMEHGELHRLMKVEFPVNVRATEGINEIQFGYMTRPTHRSRLYDSDRFEVCNQRYSALCDASHGAAVLNDCKYGISMNGNALQLTLLRAAASPEMRADNGQHRFTYAFTAWEGDFMSSPVVNEAYALNVPMQVAKGRCEGFSAFGVSAPNVFIDTVKPAEDGSGDIVLRLYEAKRADTAASVQIGIPAKKVWACDMLENKEQELPLFEGRVSLHFGTFEVKTLRIER